MLDNAELAELAIDDLDECETWFLVDALESTVDVELDTDEFADCIDAVD